MFCCLFCLLAAAQWLTVWRLLKQQPRAVWNRLRGRHASPFTDGKTTAIRPMTRNFLVGSALLFSIAVGIGWSNGSFAALDDALLASKPALRGLATWCRSLVSTP